MDRIDLTGSPEEIASLVYAVTHATGLKPTSIKPAIGEDNGERKPRTIASWLCATLADQSKVAIAIEKLTRKVTLKRYNRG